MKKYINPIYIILGFLMAVMHSTMTRNGLLSWDKFLNIRWFSMEAWNNKHDWLFFGYKIFHIWPFIIVTDFFHLAHALFVFFVCLLESKKANYKWWELVISFALYSITFEIFYSYIFINR